MFKLKLVSKIISLTAASAIIAITNLEAKAALLVTSPGTGEVKAYDEEGNFIKNFITPNSAGSGIPYSPHGISIATNGDLYLSSTFSGDILKYNSKTGAFIEFFVDGGNPNVDDLVGPFDTTLSPDGKKLYVTNFATDVNNPAPKTNNDSVLVYDTTTGNLSNKLSFINGNESPLGVALNPEDSNILYVSTIGSGVWRFNTQTGVGEKLISEDYFTIGDPFGQGEKRIAAGLQFKEDNSLLVVDFMGNRILNFDSDTGEFIEEFIEDTTVNGVVGPIALKIGPKGELFVNGGFSSNVVTYDLETGDFLETFVEANAGGLQGGNFGLAFAAIDDQPSSTVPEPSSKISLLLLGSVLIGSGLKKFSNK